MRHSQKIITLFLFIILSLPCISLSSALFGFTTSSSTYITSSSDIQLNGVSVRNDFEYIRMYGDICVGLQGDISDCEYTFSILESYYRKTNDYMVAGPKLTLNSKEDSDKSIKNSLSCKAISHICRNVVAKNLRNRQFDVNELIAGWDKIRNEPTLYWFDSYGSLQKISHGGHGSDFMFIYSQLDFQILNRRNKDNIKDSNVISIRKGFEHITEKDASAIIENCWSCIHKRSQTRLGRIQCKVLSSRENRDLDVNIFNVRAVKAS